MKPRPWCMAEPRRAGRRATLLAVGLLLVVAACSNDAPDPPAAGEPAAEAPDVPEAPDAPALPEAPTDPADTARWSVGVTTAPPTATVPPLPVLTALRAGTHADYERVTFEVAGGTEREGAAAGPNGQGSAGVPDGRPGYQLEYVDRPLIACGSGDQIFPVGEGWLEIRLEPAAAHTEAGQATLGRREVDVDGPLLQRIYRTCDFEGIVTHVLALGSPNEYRVFTLADPLRIVVDVRR